MLLEQIINASFKKIQSGTFPVSCVCCGMTCGMFSKTDPTAYFLPLHAAFFDFSKAAQILTSRVV